MRLKTIRRDKLMRDIVRGLYEAKCDYHYTDDYAFDNAYGFGKTDWLPCKVINHRDESVDGVMCFYADDFGYKSGGAYESEPGIIRLRLHSNLLYSLRKKGDKTAILSEITGKLKNALNDAEMRAATLRPMPAEQRERFRLDAEAIRLQLVEFGVAS